MKFTLSWLKDHLDTIATVEDIENALTTLGIEVEDISNPAENLKGIIIGHVISVERHPNADRLSVCTVSDGIQSHQVVCGAQNVKADMKVAFARIGTVIPSTGLPLKKGVIRNIESQGMLCSSEELLLGSDSDGIMDLDINLPVGLDFVSALRSSNSPDDSILLQRLDPVFNVSITPNRSDCFSVRGIARDLAALGIGKLRQHLKNATTIQTNGPSNLSIKIKNAEANHTPLFTARIIKGVKNGQSPSWVQQRLLAAGCRPISALVDATNLMCLDLGRPMHVFDLNKLKTQTLTIDLSKGGETLKALNDKDYVLDTNMIVIKGGDSDEILSLAGIMGGRDSAVDAQTTDVILESALFDATKIALTGQKMSLLSDSRTRFERGVDSSDVVKCLDYATKLILEWCGGEAFDIVEEKSTPHCPPNHVTLSEIRLKSVSGDDALTLEDSKTALLKLGFGIEENPDKSLLTAITPPHRHDISIDVDLIEEVLRLRGYDNTPETPLPLILPKPCSQTRLRLSSFFASQGYNEAYTWSFIPSEISSLFGKGVTLEKPITQDMAVMRPSVFPGLIRIASNGQKRSHPNCAFFEIASQYHTDTNDIVKELRTFTGIRVLHKPKRHWKANTSSPDFFLIKDEVLKALNLFGVNTVQIESDAPQYFHPGRSATLKQGKKILATIGEIHPEILKTIDLSGTVLGFEIFLDALPGEYNLNEIFQPIDAKKKNSRPKAFKASIYQSVTRDFAFWVDENVSCDKLLSLIQKVDRTLITATDVFDVYTGDKAPAGKKSIAIEVTLKPTHETLTLDAVMDIQNLIHEAVFKGCGGTLRDS